MSDKVEMPDGTKVSIEEAIDELVQMKGLMDHIDDKLRAEHEVGDNAEVVGEEAIDKMLEALGVDEDDADEDEIGNVIAGAYQQFRERVNESRGTGFPVRHHAAAVARIAGLLEEAEIPALAVLDALQQRDAWHTSFGKCSDCGDEEI